MTAAQTRAAWPPVYDATFIPLADARYWDERRETMSADERAAQTLAKLQSLVEYVWDRAPFYRSRYEAAGFAPGDLRSLDDFARLPTITKADLRADQAAHEPFGSYLCIDQHDVVRVNGTSGTSGRPTAFAFGADDIMRVREAFGRIMWSFGVRPHDVVFIGSIFSLYVGSWGALMGTERIGAAAFPFGAGVPGQTMQALSWIRQMRPSVFYGTPSYALRLAEVARNNGIEPSSLDFRIMFFSGEPGAGIPSTKALIESTFDAICIDSGSMGEMTPWMTLAECSERRGMHVWQDIVHTELVDPTTMAGVAFGGTGTPVYTHLERTSQPMIRLVSGDVAEWTDEPCPCGRTYPRFPRGIIGRIDDMVVIRGENVYPSAIEDVVRASTAVGEFEIIITRPASLDELIVRVELAADDRDTTAVLAARLKTKLGIRAVIEACAPGSLARTDLKSKRVRDLRAL